MERGELVQLELLLGPQLLGQLWVLLQDDPQLGLVLVPDAVLQLGEPGHRGDCGGQGQDRGRSARCSRLVKQSLDRKEDHHFNCGYKYVFLNLSLHIHVRRQKYISIYLFKCYRNSVQIRAF